MVSRGESVRGRTSAMASRRTLAPGRPARPATAAARTDIVASGSLRRTRASPMMINSSSVRVVDSWHQVSTADATGRLPTLQTRSTRDARWPLTAVPVRRRLRFLVATSSHSTSRNRSGRGRPCRNAAVTWLKNCPWGIPCAYASARTRLRARARAHDCSTVSCGGAISNDSADAGDRMPRKGVRRSLRRSLPSLTPRLRASLMLKGPVVRLRGRSAGRVIARWSHCATTWIRLSTIDG